MYIYIYIYIFIGMVIVIRVGIVVVITMFRRVSDKIVDLQQKYSYKSVRIGQTAE